jgi:hypothetical protein
MKLNEKMIIDYIINNWNKIMPKKLLFFKREVAWLDNWHCDITAFKTVKIFNKRIKKKVKYRMPIFIEVKFRSNSRDLIYELEKAISFRDNHELPQVIAVMSDNIEDKSILNFMKKNKIHFFKINITRDDLNSLTVTYYPAKKIDKVIKRLGE